MQDRILGILGALFLALAVFAAFFLRAGEVDLDSLEIPEIVLLAPEDGADIDGAIELTFDPGTRILPGPDGWGTGPLHLHLLVDDVELMPRRDDIRMLEGDHLYRWRLQSFDSGDYRLRIVWATDSHGSIPNGASGTVAVTVTGSSGGAGGDGLHDSHDSHGSH